MYLLTRLYHVLLYFSFSCMMTFALGLNLKHLEVCFSALFAMAIPMGQISLHPLCKQFGRIGLILPRAQTCNDDFSSTGPDPALRFLTGISQC